MAYHNLFVQQYLMFRQINEFLINLIQKRVRELTDRYYVVFFFNSVSVLCVFWLNIYFPRVSFHMRFLAKAAYTWDSHLAHLLHFLFVDWTGRYFEHISDPYISYTELLMLSMRSDWIDSFAPWIWYGRWLRQASPLQYH